MPSKFEAKEPILKVSGLKVHFPQYQGVVVRKQVGSVRAVDGVSFEVRKGETLGLVGESGCGKSTTGLAVLRMTPITEGRVEFEGKDIANYSASAMRAVRRRIQMVYQDPYGSLNPRMKVGDIIGEPLIVHGVDTERDVYRARIQELLRLVGLRPDMAERYPHEFSGGQRQRISIARAVALNPALVICDEPVSALDVSIQAQVVNLFQELQERLGLSYLFIAHDLAVVRHVSHRIAVMYLGRIVEVAPRNELYKAPLHPYTQGLLAAVPIPNPSAEALRPQQVILGEPPSVMNPPSGCRFHPRCPLAMKVCAEVDPPLLEMTDGRAAACHLHDPSISGASRDGLRHSAPGGLGNAEQNVPVSA
ncbi:ATP-binding cassette domain-containing protein [Rhodopseudomonas boonkerdii]|uniref:ABC transporter ATP-binding protein n=1 Tax=Rhodopseudomonas boonkerdii TaxID=475937 RepID=UPI001E2BD010|nr:oligopeptide/dipeptide ABC transporter ATP-binding protein [Rhodopseudomonas boonkerdii]UGV26623.1 ATP-binding cassette domain-containing protein [Rhodopseudomonas boonkerdii]